MQTLPIHHTSRYAPIRYEATRPYAIRLAGQFLANAKAGEAARHRYIRQGLLPQLKTEVGKLGYEDGPGPVQSEISSIQQYAYFYEGGRLVFDVNHVLSAALRETTLEDLPCDALTFPSQSFYVHFGAGSGLIDDGYEIEGAYVSFSAQHKRMMFDLVPAGTFAVPEFWALPRGEQCTGGHVDLGEPGRSVTDALKLSMDAIVERNRAILAQIKEVEQQLEKQYGQVVRIPTPIEGIQTKYPLLEKGLRLLVNIILYLNAAPDDEAEEWELDAPQTLVQQAQTGEKPGTRRMAENTLKNQGYVKVKYVGRQFAQSKEGAAITDSLQSGRTMPTHFRRGHFRRQRFGVERAQQKVIFIAPVVVNANRGDEAPGRVYEVR